MYDKDLYFVAVKLFLRDGTKLLITHDIFGAWDLPGGRVKVDEFDTSLEAVIARKVREELGAEVAYELGDPKVFFRVERQEHSLNGQKVRIFAVGYEASYKSGTVTLGEHHDQLEWVDVDTFRADSRFEGGWLTGVNEYLNLVRVPRI